MMGGDPTKPLKPEQRHFFSIFAYHSTRFRLMLHPFKASQQEVYDLVNRTLTLVSENKWESATKIRQELLNASGKLLKKEWDEIQDKAVGLLMDQQNLKV